MRRCAPRATANIGRLDIHGPYAKIDFGFPNSAECPMSIHLIGIWFGFFYSFALRNFCYQSQVSINRGSDC